MYTWILICTVLVVAVATTVWLYYNKKQTPDSFVDRIMMYHANEGFQSPAVADSCLDQSCPIPSSELQEISNEDAYALVNDNTFRINTGGTITFAEKVNNALRTATDTGSCRCLERGIPLTIASKLVTSHAFTQVDDWTNILQYLTWQNVFFARILLAGSRRTDTPDQQTSLQNYIRGVAQDDASLSAHSNLMTYNLRLFSQVSKYFPLDVESFKIGTPIYVRNNHQFTLSMIRKFLVDIVLNHAPTITTNVTRVQEFLFENRGLRVPGKLIVDGFIQNEFRYNKTVMYHVMAIRAILTLLICLKEVLGSASFATEFKTPLTNAMGQSCNLKDDLQACLNRLKDSSIRIPSGLNVSCASGDTSLLLCSDPAVRDHITRNVYFDHFKHYTFCNPEIFAQRFDGVDGSFGPLLGIVGHSGDTVAPMEALWRYVFEDVPLGSSESNTMLDEVGVTASEWIHILQTWKSVNPSQDQTLSAINQQRISALPYIQKYYLNIATCPTSFIADLRSICFNSACEYMLKTTLDDLSVQVSQQPMPVGSITEFMGYYMASRRTMGATVRDLSVSSSTAITILRNVLDTHKLTPRSRLEYLYYLLGRLYIAFLQNMSLRSSRDAIISFLLEDIDGDGYIRSESRLTADEFSARTIRYITRSFQYLSVALSAFALLKYVQPTFVLPTSLRTVFERALDLTVKCPDAPEAGFNCQDTPLTVPDEKEISNMIFQRRIYARGILRYSADMVGTMNCNDILNKMPGIYNAHRKVKAQYDYLFKGKCDILYEPWGGIGLMVYNFPFRDELLDTVNYWLERRLFTEIPVASDLPTDSLQTVSPSVAPPLSSSDGIPIPAPEPTPGPAPGPTAPSCAQYCEYVPGIPDIQPAYSCMLRPGVPLANTEVGTLPAVPDWLTALASKMSLSQSERDMTNLWLRSMDVCAEVDDFLLAIRRQIQKPLAPSPAPGPAPAPTTDEEEVCKEPKPLPKCPPTRKVRDRCC